MNLFACLSPVKDLQYFLWFTIVQSLIAFLATPMEMPQGGSGPINGCSAPILANWSAVFEILFLFYRNKIGNDTQGSESE
jgi:hypothetical protein